MLRRNFVQLAIVATLLGALAGTALAQPIEFTLKVTPSTGTMNDEYVATVQMIIRGVDGPDRFWAPDFGEFTVIDQRTSQSTQWSYDPVRGQEIRDNEVRRFVLKPRRAGKLTIGPARLRLDGADYETRPAVVEVLDAASVPGGVVGGGASDPSQPPPPDADIVGQTFLHVAADRTKVYQGEQVTVTWWLYTRSEVLKYEPKPPRLDDLWSETLYEPQNYLNYSEQVVGGRTYSVAMVARRALFPSKPGKIVVPKFEADVGTMATPFGQPLHLASREVVLDVQPLPPGAPQGFDPAYVGQFSVEAGIDRDNVPAGESLSLTVVVRGAGALRRTKIPPLALDGFQVYPPRDFDEKIDATTGVVRGERRYTYVLTPARGGMVPVGPIELPYFDPAAGRYEVARSDLSTVKVVGDPALLAGGGGALGENVISREIRPARRLAEVSSRIAVRAYKSRVFWLVLVAPLAAFLMIVGADKVRERLRRDTPRARLRRARGRARKRLRLAELHIKGSRAGKFFGEIARVLIEHVEERVGEPVAAMTRDQLRSFLPQRGFPEETVDALVRELENCDFARFAPSASGPGEMRAALRRVRALLHAIERVRPVADAEEAAA